MEMAHILVILELSNGLSDSIEIRKGYIIYSQDMESEGIPFK
jgi:hypothetical protein